MRLEWGICEWIIILTIYLKSRIKTKTIRNTITITRMIMIAMTSERKIKMKIKKMKIKWGWRRESGRGWIAYENNSICIFNSFYVFMHNIIYSLISSQL